jgi:hypothetical protein
MPTKLKMHTPKQNRLVRSACCASTFSESFIASPFVPNCAKGAAVLDILDILDIEESLTYVFSMLKMGLSSTQGPARPGSPVK